MKVRQLIRLLEKIAEDGPNLEVCVDWESFNCSNGVFDVVGVGSATVEWVRRVDGDGFAEYDSRGREKGSTCVVLRHEIPTARGTKVR
jgi:hypothetical protein